LAESVWDSFEYGDIWAAGPGEEAGGGHGSFPMPAMHQQVIIGKVACRLDE
jgi:hypothetical protein